MLQTIADFFDKVAVTLGDATPLITPNHIRWIGVVLFGLLALLLLLKALRLLFRPRRRNTSSLHTDIPRILQQKGAVIDVLTDAEASDFSVRCVVVGVRPSRITCEIIERYDGLLERQGKSVTCIFAPLKTRSGKINSFTAPLEQYTEEGRKADRLVLGVPKRYDMISRRKHARKRVADQQFIRVKLWVADAASSDIAFEDAVPHISVNSLSPEHPEQAANGVLDLSGKGIALSVLEQSLPTDCAEGAPIVLNLFMFNFREKTFKPYWYAGTVKSLKPARPGFARLGLVFDAVGGTDRKTGRLFFESLT